VVFSVSIAAAAVLLLLLAAQVTGGSYSTGGVGHISDAFDLADGFAKKTEASGSFDAFAIYRILP
jgi:hypothetical protein